MKQKTKESEVTQMQPVITGKQIPYVRVDENLNTGKFILLLLNFNPKMVYPDNPDFAQWGVTTQEMLERRAIRKIVAEVTDETKTITLTNEQAKILHDMCGIIKWGGDDEFILNFWESVK